MPLSARQRGYPRLIDDDLDAPEDFEKEHVEKPSLKEIWDNNPPLKLVAIVLGAAVILRHIYNILFPRVKT